MGSSQSRASQPEPIVLRSEQQQPSGIHLSERLLNRLQTDPTQQQQQQKQQQQLYTQSQVDKLLAQQKQQQQPSETSPLDKIKWAEQYSVTSLMQQIDQLLADHPATSATQDKIIASGDVERLNSIRQELEQCYKTCDGRVLDCRSLVDKYQLFVRHLYEL